MDLKLQGKRALVTGSSRGLGFAAARGLALEGARVAVNSRDAASATAAAQKLTQEAHTPALALSGDLTDPSTPDRLVQAVVDAWGGLDILITNAGGPPPGPFEAFDDDAWQKAAEVSLFAHARLIRAALPALRESPAASVLSVTSYAVKQPIPNLVLSNSVRAATAALIKSLAIELGPAGIRFNAILPGSDPHRARRRADGLPRQGQRHHHGGGKAQADRRDSPGAHGQRRRIRRHRRFPGLAGRLLHHRPDDRRGRRHYQEHPVTPPQHPRFGGARAIGMINQ